jgi:hypothetical protein
MLKRITGKSSFTLINGFFMNNHYCRRATCYMQILKPQSAVSDFRKVLALDPKNETVRSQMVSTQKLIRKIEFEKV